MWIAVHEQIDGPKLRQFRKEAGCSKCEAKGILLTLWLWGLQNADRSGRLKGVERTDLEELYEGALTKRVMTETVINALISAGWVNDIGGELYIHDWKDWQEQLFKYLDKLEYDKRRKSENNRKFSGNTEEQSEEIPTESSGNENGKSHVTITNTITNTKPDHIDTEEDNDSLSEKQKNAMSLKAQREAAFNIFWAAYPRKKAKGAARKAWEKVDIALLPVMLEAITTQKQSQQWKKEDGQFIPHPSTWLNQTRWEDEPERKNNAGGKGFTYDDSYKGGSIDA